MIRQTPPTSELLQGKFLADQRRLVMFIKDWGTETMSNGTTILKRSHLAWSKYGDLTNAEQKVINRFGLDGVVKAQDKKDLKYLWTRLNPAKVEGTDATMATRLADNLTSASASNAVALVTFGSKVERKPHRFDYKVTSLPTDLTAATLVNNFSTYYADGYTVEVAANNPYIKALTLAMLRGQLAEVTDPLATISSFKRADVEVAIPHPSDYKDTWYEYKTYPGYSFVVDIPTITFTDTHPLVLDIMANIDNDDKYSYLKYAKTEYSDFGSDRYDVQSSTTYQQFIFADFASFWVHDVDYAGITTRQNSTDWVLDVDAFLADTTMSKEAKWDYLRNAIDFEYTQRDLTFLESLAVAIVFFVAVIAAAPSGGASLAAADILWFATILAIGTMVVAQFSELSLAAGNLSQISSTMEMMVVIATVVTFSEGVFNKLEEAARKGTEQSLLELVGSDLIDAVVGDYDQLFAGTMTSAKQGLDLFNRSYGLYMDNKLKGMRNEIKASKKQLGEQEAELEAMRTNDMAKLFQLAMFQPITMDNSQYSMFERPYNSWKTPYHLGNVQANGVNALWLSKD